MKHHERRELVNTLTKIAREYGQTQQLRERIAHALPFDCDLFDDDKSEFKTTWAVRQQVITARKSWLEDVFVSACERTASKTYEQAVKENPCAYFELVEVTKCETCKAFSSVKIPASQAQD